MRVARRGGLHDDVALTAQALIDQMRMHRAGCQQCMDRQLFALRVAVAEEHQRTAAAHGLRHLITQCAQRRFQALLGRIHQIEARRADELRQRQQLPQLALGQDRRIDQHLFRVLRFQLEHVALGADLRHQRHDQLFAQRVDRWIGDLREALTEAIEQRAHLP